MYLTLLSNRFKLSLELVHSGISRILWTDSSSCLNPLCCWIHQSKLKHLKHCVLNFFKALTWINCIVCSSEIHWQTHFHEDFCCLERIALPRYYNTACCRRDSIDSVMFSNFLLGFSSNIEKTVLCGMQFMISFCFSQKVPFLSSTNEFLSLSLSLSLCVLEDAVMYIDVYCNLKL